MKKTVEEMRREAMKSAVERADRILETAKKDAAAVIRVDIRDSLVQTGDYRSFFPNADTRNWR